MNLAERIYRMLLRLYPTNFRLAYGTKMLQHARDLGRAASQQGCWYVARLCLHLLRDALVNSASEHIEAFVMSKERFQPTPWTGVLLASWPGLLIAFSRQYTDRLAPLLTILGFAYLGLLVLWLPLVWRQSRRFPVWALMPAGALAWILTYLSGSGLSRLVNSLHIHNLPWIGIEPGIALVNFSLTVILFYALTHRQRLPASAWLVISLLLVSNLMLALIHNLNEYSSIWQVSGILQFFTIRTPGPLEGLMLVAVGLLAARQHGVLALLVVTGGYTYICSDMDYLFGHPDHSWPGLGVYLSAVSILYLVITPIGLLRARTRLGRILAVFVPSLAFHLIRIITPFLIIEQPIKLRSGEIIATINILLTLLLGWLLYSHFGAISHTSQLETDLDAETLSASR